MSREKDTPEQPSAAQPLDDTGQVDSVSPASVPEPATFPNWDEVVFTKPNPDKPLATETEATPETIPSVPPRSSDQSASKASGKAAAKALRPVYEPQKLSGEPAEPTLVPLTEPPSAPPEPEAQTKPAGRFISIDTNGLKPRLHLYKSKLVAKLPQQLTQALQTVYTRLGKRLSIGITTVIGLLALVAIGHNLLTASPSVVASASSSSGAVKGISVVAGGTSSTKSISVDNSTASGAKPSSKPPATLSFTPVVPADELQLAKLGSSAYDSTLGTYTFNDLYLATPLQVSEEQLPQGATVAAAATSFKATTPIGTTSGTAYMTSPTGAAKQIVVFTTKGVLVIIQTAYGHSSTDWSGYLNSLQ